MGFPSVVIHKTLYLAGCAFPASVLFQPRCAYLVFILTFYWLPQLKASIINNKLLLWVVIPQPTL